MSDECICPSSVITPEAMLGKDSRKYRSFLISCHIEQQAIGIFIVRMQSSHQMLSKIQTFPAT